MEYNSKNVVCQSKWIDKSALLLLKDKWLTIEQTQSSPVFLSWSWIEAWANICKSAQSDFFYIEASMGSDVVGMAIFHLKSVWQIPGQKTKQLWLHRHGSDKEDQVWTEHNDFLMHPDYASACRQAIFAHLLSQPALWHEIYIGMSDKKSLDTLLPSCPHQRIVVEAPAYRADLSQQQNIGGFLASLSRNTRSSLNRARRKLLLEGELHLEYARDVKQKSAFLQRISQIHREKWRETIHGSGFDNPLFCEFHQQLLLEDLHNQHTRLYRLSQQGEALGFVYLLTSADTWYFYLSAINFHPDPQIKVGMLMHSFIMEKAIEQGVKVYDFMAGQAQYKESLSNTEPYCQQLVCFYRPTPVLLLREFLRKLKAKLLPSKKNHD